MRNSKELGGNFATAKPKLETGGSIRYRYDGSDVENTSSVEYFNATLAKFNENYSKNFTSNQRVTSNFRFEWKPDTMTSIIFRPNFTYSRNRGRGYSSSGSYSADPNEYTANALDYNDQMAAVSWGAAINPANTILNNLKKLKAGKAAFVPQSGVILKDAAVPLEEGDTAFTVLRRACETHPCEDNCQYCQKAGGIQLEYTFTPVFETYYIEGIHQLYEKDCGTMSGWMFSVNGQFPEECASSVTVAKGDRIVFCYTCDMGDDVGNHFEG